MGSLQFVGLFDWLIVNSPSLWRAHLHRAFEWKFVGLFDWTYQVSPLHQALSPGGTHANRSTAAVNARTAYN